MAILTTFPVVIDPFKQGEHSGLTFYYGAGKARADNVVTQVAAGNIELADDDINYIEVSTAGVISTNVDGFTSGKIPLWIVTTETGEIIKVEDCRCFFNASTLAEPFLASVDGAVSLSIPDLENDYICDSGTSITVSTSSYPYP